MPPAVQDSVVYTSWNEATGITSWEIFSGDTESNFNPVGYVNSTGFKTNFTFPSSSGGLRRRQRSETAAINARDKVKWISFSI